jgi:hypothetical protein
MVHLYMQGPTFILNRAYYKWREGRPISTIGQCFFFPKDFSPNFNLKKMIFWTYNKDFPWKKKDPNSPNLENFNCKCPIFHDKFH